jgi:hypothetical protein
MKIKKYGLTSRLFLITGVINLLYSIIVRFFLNNPDMGKRFKNFNKEFLVSDIYLIIGVVWIIFSLIYLLDDYLERNYFSEKLKKIHFYFTLPMILILIITPILETYYPTSESVRKGIFYELFTYGSIISAFGIIIGLITFLINLFKGILTMTGLIKQ